MALQVSNLMAMLPSESLFVLCVLSAAIIFWSLRKGPKRPPGPPGEGVLIENTRQVKANLPRFLDWMLENSLKHGGSSGQGTWGFRVFLAPHYTVTNDPECIKHVLTNVDDFGKGPVWRRNFFPILGDGIFSADHHNWFMQRKTASHMFKVNNFKSSILQSIRDKTVELVSILHSRLDDETGTGDVDMQELFFRFTLDTIGKIAFGKDLRSLSGENEDFMRAFDFGQLFANDLFFLPGHAFFYVHFTPRGWAFKRHVRVLEDYGNKLITDVVIKIQKRRKEEQGEDSHDEEDEKGRQETILSLFLDRGETEELLKPESLRKLRDVIMNFQIAGRDTVAQALSWSMYLLCTNPDVQEKVFQEASSVIGDTPIGKVTYEQINQLKYIHATATEVLRLYPSVPKEGKWAFRDNVLPDGTRVEKDTWVMFAPYVMGRLESLWPDALKFDPSRHIDTPRPSNFKFTAFQAGPRICLGQNLAYMQLQYVIAVLALEFKMEMADPKQDVKPVHTSATLPQAQGVRVRLTRRRPQQPR